jgi:hypothetical protein
MRTGGGERGDPRARKKEKEPRKERAEPKSHWRPRTKKRKKDQTFVPLFLLKETEEVKEKKQRTGGKTEGKKKAGITEKPLEKHRTGGRIEKTFVPLFLLKETEEATERDHEQRRKKAASPPVLHHVSVSLLPERK